MVENRSSARWRHKLHCNNYAHHRRLASHGVILLGCEIWPPVYLAGVNMVLQGYMAGMVIITG